MDEPNLTEAIEVGTSRRILRNTAYRAVADVGSKLVSIVLYVVMARRLGQSQFGVFTFGLAFVTLVSALGELGQDQILVREVARDRRKLSSYFGNTLALRVAVTLPVLIVVLAIGAAIGFDGRKLLVVAFLGAGVIVELGISTVIGSFQAFERLEFAPLVLITQRVLTTAVAVIAIAFGADVVAVALIYLGSALLAFFVGLALLRSKVVRPKADIDVRRWWPLMRAALPLGIAGISATILFRIDTVMLQAYKPDAVVGAYGAAYRLFETTLFLSWSVGAAIYPVMSRLTRTTDPPVALVFERGLKLAIALTLPLAVGAAVLANGVLATLYGNEFLDAAPALRLLAPAIATFPFAFIAGQLLVSQDRQAAMTITYLVVTVENIALNLYLIPRFSLDGAAFGTSLSEVLVVTGLLAFCFARIGRIAWGRAFAGPVVASALAGAAMFLLRDRFLPAAAAGALVYGAALLAVERLAFPGEFTALLGLVRREERVPPAS
ncbi:MAG TPA: flippase [Actinomycetota bacterium]|nr:flippase [Actinomycetota bacterium]